MAIGSYEVIGKLGEGGMGAVFLGKGGDGRLVAIKVIRPELAADRTFRGRFEDEVSHAQRVASFCTAAVLAHGEEDGRPYMVTEFVDGTPLEKYVKEQGALQPGTLHGVAVGVAAALTAIHAAGLVHRDLKPANVMLSVSGPRVIDFGIARAADNPSQHTQVGFVIGSPGFMAPEQVLRNEVSTAVDIFAWGCLVAHAGIGRNPYGSGTVMTMAARAEQGEPDLDGLDEPLRGLVRRALAPNPADRPSAQDLLLALVGGGDPAAAAATELLNGPAGAASDARDGRTAVADVQAFADQEIHRTWRAETLPPPWSAPSPPPGMPVPGSRHAGHRAAAPVRPMQAAPPPTAPPPAPVYAQPPVPQAPPPAPLAPVAPVRPAPVPPPAPAYGGGSHGGTHRGSHGGGRSGSGISGGLIAFVIILVLALIVGITVYRKTRPGEGEVGAPAPDGQFTFTVQRGASGSAMTCGSRASVRGLVAAKGRFCAVRFTVVNHGDKARTLAPEFQEAEDAEGNTENGVYLFQGSAAQKNAIEKEELAPGDKLTAVLVFDVPTAFEPTALVLHDGKRSNGVRLSLN